MRRKYIYNTTDGHCFYCNKMLEEDWHIDHFHPKSKGGGNSEDNLVPSCQKCNILKLDLIAIDFAKKVFRRIDKLNEELSHLIMIKMNIQNFLPREMEVEFRKFRGDH